MNVYRTGLINAAVALICFASFTGPVIAGPAPGTPAWGAGVVGAAAIAPTIWSHRFPLAALATVTAVLMVASLTDIRFTVLVSNAGPAFGIAVAWCAYRLPWRTSLAMCALASFGVTAVGFTVWATYSRYDQNAVQLVLAIPAWLLGTLLSRERSHRNQHVDEQREIEAQKEARIRAEERLRVSRDIHDVVSHSLSMIALRSGVARVVLDRDPHEARIALAAIEESSRRSLDEVRRVLVTVRNEVSPLNPQLSDLTSLTSTAWPGALEIYLNDCSDHDNLDPQVQTTAYRIVQEALTNVVRHSHAAHASVEISSTGTSLTVRVTDDGVGAPVGAGQGLGLTGMRERVATHNGTLFTDNVDGGYRIEAEIPYE
ncbi:sensor histidine kinase [Tsukamurella sp. 8F]|uniref:sensor histidine kinase n=1 Tax=unclassified Tsukamurella TaxID=2633480 RepID=UPI0023B8D751|nr:MULTISPECIES: sensor histidine kinase [unclassified Tsukamurella]MDF0531550.1 sensor histidine kinase [Tsukamurella sp. 8J]MDF0588838.1 sensor histidine kinase [Tsukamurella sp. 8F]